MLLTVLRCCCLGSLQWGCFFSASSGGLYRAISASRKLILYEIKYLSFPLFLVLVLLQSKAFELRVVNASLQHYTWPPALLFLLSLIAPSHVAVLIRWCGCDPDICVWEAGVCTRTVPQFCRAGYSLGTTLLCVGPGERPCHEQAMEW